VVFGVRVVLLTLLILFADVAAAYTAERPSSIASTSGTGTARVSASGGNRWHVVVTTKPARLRVLVEVAGRPDRVGKSPIRIDYRCKGCAVRVTARLWPANGKSAPTSATLKVTLYRR
jgi:hypothetical protein